MATSVADVALMWSVLTESPIPEPRLEGLTVGLLTQPPSVGGSRPPASSATERHVARLEELGARVVEATIPEPREDTWPLFFHEAAESHRETFPARADEYGENVRTKMQRCLDVTDEEVAVARRLRAEYRDLCDEATDGIDLLVTPTIPFVAPPADVDELTIRERGISLTFPFDSLGWPAVAIPCGPAENGLPASVQLVGPPGEDALVLAAGRLLASLI
jgi:aspartyl-tRNA(Asn)/glutamyl-tRNA(Gln) amidotransferase subunit A